MSVIHQDEGKIGTFLSFTKIFFRTDMLSLINVEDGEPLNYVNAKFLSLEWICQIFHSLT